MKNIHLKDMLNGIGLDSKHQYDVKIYGYRIYSYSIGVICESGHH